MAIGSGTAIHSYLFWSDGTGENAKIERSDLSGNGRTVLVSSTQGLVSPTTLVVDYNSEKLFWLDSGAAKIGRLDFNGSQLLNWDIPRLRNVSAMTLYRVRILYYPCPTPTNCCLSIGIFSNMDGMSCVQLGPLSVDPSVTVLHYYMTVGL